MEQIPQIIKEIGTVIWGWPMIILLLGTHLFLTIRLRFPQRKIFTAIKLSIQKDEKSKGDVSQFAALATALAATIGTGNIIGVATAIALGGPGAVFWCWLTGVLGIATKYSEGLLAIKYRVTNERGEMSGGPMYALEYGLKSKWLAVLFCVFTAVAALGIGNMVQSNSIAKLVYENWSIDPQFVGIGLVVLVALVIIFGVKGIAKVCTTFVPLMAFFYIGGCVWLMCININYVPEAISVILKEAFTFDAAGGGAIGAGMIMAMRYGIARGLFSNESGLGSAPIVAAAAQTRNPVRQALVSASGTFWDTVIICALTGIVLVSCILAYPDIDYTKGAALTSAAFSKIPMFGSTMLTISLFTFAFSTILGWCYYGEKAVEYLSSVKYIKVYRLIWIIAVYVGAVAELNIVWDISDVMNALMALPNLIALLLLSGVVARETRHYLWDNHLNDYAPPMKIKKK